MKKIDWTKVGLKLTPAAFGRNPRRDPDTWHCVIRLPCTRSLLWPTSFVERYKDGKERPIVITLDEGDLELCDPSGWVDAGLVEVVEHPQRAKPAKLAKRAKVAEEAADGGDTRDK